MWRLDPQLAIHSHVQILCRPRISYCKVLKIQSRPACSYRHLADTKDARCWRRLFKPDASQNAPLNSEVAFRSHILPRG